MSSQIAKETRKLQKLVVEYNIRTSPEEELSLEMATNPQTTLGSSSSWSPSEKHDIIQAYLRKQRSEEEIKLLGMEMKQTLDSLQHKENVLTSACKYLMQFKDRYSCGAYSILASTKSKTQYLIKKTQTEFDRVYKMNNEEFLDETNSDNDSDSDSNSDVEV